MQKPNRPNLISQAERDGYRRILTDPRIDLPWRPAAQGAVLPCEGMPLCESSCGVASAAQVLSMLRNESACPLNRPTGCPFSHTPDL
jgi:hypothetical protein